VDREELAHDLLERRVGDREVMAAGQRDQASDHLGHPLRRHVEDQARRLRNALLGEDDDAV
jgi:hypothetical protein